MAEYPYLQYRRCKDFQEALFEHQRGRCGICGRTFYLEYGRYYSTEFNQTTLLPYLDHDHETGLVRGFLCRFCNSHLMSNRWIGLSQDIDPERGLAYLANPPANTLKSLPA